MVKEGATNRRLTCVLRTAARTGRCVLLPSSDSAFSGIHSWYFTYFSPTSSALTKVCRAGVRSSDGKMIVRA